MENPSPASTDDQLSQLIRSTLNHLYDTATLRRDPLGEHLGIPGRGTTEYGRALCKTLLDAIEALRPPSGTPSSSPDWVRFRVLELRYVEAASPSEAMRALFMGRSTFFVEQARALEALTSLLRDREQGTVPGGETDASARASGEALSVEVERVSYHATPTAVDHAELVASLRAIAGPVAEDLGIDLHFHALDALGHLQADRVLLRQAVLSALMAAVNIPGVQRVEVSGAYVHGTTRVEIRASLTPGSARSVGESSSLEQAIFASRRLMRAMNGNLSASLEGDEYRVGLTWPVQAPLRLAVVDDNQAFLELFRRYLANTAWQVYGARDGEEARRLIREIRPTIVTLDVLMPNEDGWDILRALKGDPETRDIPVIVCSVLKHPELARTLGAEGYLPKPVTQEALLGILARWERGTVS
jgi:CheY-like chemotaxis protein